MKNKLIVIIIIVLMIKPVKAQLVNDSIEEVSSEKVDTTRIRLGNKGITIIDRDGKTEVDIQSIGENNNNGNYSREIDKEGIDKSWKNNEWNSGNKNKKFRFYRKNNVQWAGLSLGLNNFVYQGFESSLPDTISFMKLDPSHSYSWGINIDERSYALSSQFYIVTGMGFDFDYFRFDGNNNIEEVDEVIKPRIPSDGIKYKKSKLFVSHLVIPLMIEYKFPFDKGLTLDAGVVGNVKLWARTKTEHDHNGDDVERKEYNDFNIRLLRYGFRGQIGYSNVSIFGCYYPMTFFDGDKDPEIQQFKIGILFSH